MPTLAVFTAPQIATAVQRFIEVLVRRGRRYSTVAGYVGSYVVCARYVRTCRKVDPSAVDQLAALHMQCLQQARQQAAFDAASATNHLDGEGVPRARCAAEAALARYKGSSAVKKLRLTRDVTLVGRGSNVSLCFSCVFQRL